MPTNLRITGHGFWYDQIPIQVAIIKWLGDRGEVTGSGSGRDGWEIEFTLGDDSEPDEFAAKIRTMLSNLGAKDTKVAAVD